MKFKLLVHKIALFVFRCKKRFLLRSCIVICDEGGRFIIGGNVKLHRCKIHIYKNASLFIGNNTILEKGQIRVFQDSIVDIGANCRISDTAMFVSGTVKIGDYNICEKGYNYRPMTFDVKGNVFVGNYNRLRCVILSRFNSVLEIGNYNNVNEESEIRCDEKITIGDFNQISYRCSIWDTNTHNIYEASIRRDLTIKKYPMFGYEYERPKTNPILIGNDNWIGKNATLLKGTVIGDRCIIGCSTFLIKIHVPDNNTVVQSHDLKIFSNKI